jgi:hypothetical protein
MAKVRTNIYSLSGLGELIIEKNKSFITAEDLLQIAKKLKKSLEGENVKISQKRLSGEGQFWVRDFFYFTEIVHCFEHFGYSLGFLQKFPSFRYYNFYRISELVWLRYHIESYLQEVYILRERSYAWLNYLIKKSKSNHKTRIEQRLKRHRDAFHATFVGICGVRSSHVHLKRYGDPELIKLETLELLTGRSRLRELAPLKALYFQLATMDWVKTIRNNTSQLVKLYEHSFSSLKANLIELGQSFLETQSGHGGRT